MEDTINTGNTAWVLMSAALVLVMTPGLAMFYGGMVRAKSVLNMLMMCFLSMGIVTIIWVTVGFSLTFGTDSALGLIGNFEYIGLNNTSVR
jgi:Amt family ammonium transporter